MSIEWREAKDKRLLGAGSATLGAGSAFLGAKALGLSLGSTAALTGFCGAAAGVGAVVLADRAEAKLRTAEILMRFSQIEGFEALKLVTPAKMADSTIWDKAKQWWDSTKSPYIELEPSSEKAAIALLDLDTLNTVQLSVQEALGDTINAMIDSRGLTLVDAKHKLAPVRLQVCSNQGGLINETQIVIGVPSEAQIAAMA